MKRLLIGVVLGALLAAPATALAAPFAYGTFSFRSDPYGGSVTFCLPATNLSAPRKQAE